MSVQTPAPSRPARPPTPRQLEVVAFVRDFIEREGMSPTVREIAAALAITTNAVAELLYACERKGLLRRRPGAARSWRPA